MSLLTELLFHWIWLIYKGFAPNGAENQSALSKKRDAPDALAAPIHERRRD
jgi:hypothetical protein